MILPGVEEMLERFPDLDTPKNRIRIREWEEWIRAQSKINGIHGPNPRRNHSIRSAGV